MEPKSKPGRKETDRKTPPPEMQMEDAGTPASGNSGLGGRATAEEGQIHQSTEHDKDAGDGTDKR